MLKEKLFILLTSIFGGKTAIAYVVVGLVLAERHCVEYASLGLMFRAFLCLSTLEREPL